MPWQGILLLYYSAGRQSERISDGEVESEAVAEALHVVVSAIACVVGSMYTDAEVATDYHHADIKPQSDTGAYGHFPSRMWRLRAYRRGAAGRP